MPAVLTAWLVAAGLTAPALASAHGGSTLGDSLVAWVTESCEAISVELNWLGLDESWIHPNDTFQWEGRPCSARPAVRLTVIREGEVHTHRTLQPGLAILVEAPIAVSAVKAGELVRLMPGEVLIQDLRGDPVSLTGEQEWRARVRINEGAAVTENIVEPMPDALSGSPVSVVVHRGSLVVSAPGRLLEDAHLGQPVRVVNDSTRVALKGVLASPGIVEIP